METKVSLSGFGILDSRLGDVETTRITRDAKHAVTIRSEQYLAEGRN